MTDWDNEVCQYSSVLSHVRDLQHRLLVLEPMAKELRLLASNAMSCALRAKQGNASLRVLAHDLQAMNDVVIQCMEEGLSAIEPLLALSYVDKEVTSDDQQPQRRSLSLAVQQALISLFAVEQVVKKGNYIAVFFKLERAGEETQAQCDRLVEQCQKVMSSFHQQMKENHLLSERLSDCLELKPTELAFN